MAIPDEITENEADDIQSVDFNLQTLVSRFIVPIERKRSFSTINPITRPQSSANTGNNAEAVSRDLDIAQPNVRVQESRAHAFYRMIGLPVMDKNGGFYNPGFNPLASTDARKNNAAIANNPSLIVDQMHAAREQDSRDAANIFRNSPLESSIRALAMKKPKKFQLMTNQGAFNFLTNKDAQIFTIKDRKTFINKFYTDATGNELTVFFDQSRHILRPFLVSPVIERTVQSRNRQVCVPFLKDRSDTIIERDNAVLERPGIEFILRLRLRQKQEEELLQETIFVLDPQLETEGVSAADLRRIAISLFDKEKISTDDAAAETAIFSDFELVNINNLVKLIKAAIDQLNSSVETLDRVGKKIHWTPLPGIDGPQIAAKTRNAGFVRTKRASSELDRKIKQLEIKIKNSKRRTTISDNSEIANSPFALSYFENTEKLFEQELGGAKEEKNELIRQGANALSTIEIITGEVSGLGLVDILAIYTALWAIDLDVLISLLDNDAFTRLVNNNPDLINTNVQARRDSGAVFGGIEAVQKLESQIINILEWADKLFEQKQGTPDEAEGGALPQGG